MNLDVALLFDELRSLLDRRVGLRQRCLRLQEFMQRVCIAETAESHADFSGLFSRLYALCSRHGVDHRPADRVRRDVRRYLSGETAMDEAGYARHWSALCRWIAEVYAVSLPSDLPVAAAIPEHSVARPDRRASRMRLTVLRVEDACIHAVSTDTSAEENYRLTCPPGAPILRQVEAGTQINVLDYACEGGVLRPSMVVLEPDYLLDVSALSACVKPYGSHPYNYLLSRFAPRDVTLPILLGNAANGFMDDCVNRTQDDAGSQAFRRSMQKHFRESLLEYATYAGPLPGGYFSDARTHYNNIYDTVSRRFDSPDIGLPGEAIVLEPSFICEAMGLRGRLDVMSLDHRNVVELKSGRADDFGHEPRPRPEHALQMALYKAILHYNFGLSYDDIHTYLLYSRYPVFYYERSSGGEVARAVALRNAIVHNELRLCRGEFSRMLDDLTVETLNERRMTGRLFRDYLAPPIERMCGVLRSEARIVEGRPSLAARYFQAFLTFLAREQFLAKTGDNRPDSNRGFARVWTADVATKQAGGDILTDLRLCSAGGGESIERLVFSLPDYGPDFLPNFSEGEMVQLYERNAPTDNVTNRQLFRAYIERLTGDRLTLRLAYAQRNPGVLPPDSRYAVEHDSSDAPFTQCFRSLYQFLLAPVDRRRFLLGQRPPRCNEAVTLRGRYLNPAIDAIVLAAKQAEDVYLLVGPPGTGKTNVALRSMVEEFCLERDGRPDRCLLLTAYTNRAVDEICQMLSTLDPTMDYVRIGAEQTCAAPYRPHLLPDWADGVTRRDELVERLAAVPVVVGTVATLTAHQELFRLKTFAAALVDEASQLLEPQLLGLMSATSEGRPAIAKFVLIGDPKQLPAVVMQSAAATRVDDEELRTMGLHDLAGSLFERLYRRFRAEGRTDCVGHLDVQGRMHPGISRYVNRLFYGGRLRPVPLAHQCGPLPFVRIGAGLAADIARVRLGFVNVVPDIPVGNNKVNAAEAAAVGALVEAIARLYALNGLPFDAARQIGVIVPFRAQIALVRRSLAGRGVAGSEGITVDTVECYQGSQRDHIVFCTTIRQPYQVDQLSSVQRVDGVAVDRKLNVAVTRARLQMFVVGNGPLLARSPLYRELMAEADSVCIDDNPTS